MLNRITTEEKVAKYIRIENRYSTTGTKEEREKYERGKLNTERRKER